MNNEAEDVRQLLDALRSSGANGEWDKLETFLKNDAAKELTALAARYRHFVLTVEKYDSAASISTTATARSLSGMCEAKAAYGVTGGSTPQVSLGDKTAVQPPSSPLTTPRAVASSAEPAITSTDVRKSVPAGPAIKRIRQTGPAAEPPPPPAPPSTVAAPNGTVGRSYEFCLADHLVDGRPSKIVLVDVADLATLGLEWDETTKSIRGTPERAGEFVLGIQDERRIRTSGHLLPQKSIRLTINPDPRSLWKDIPSDPSAPYAKLEQDTKLIRAERTLVAASQRGRSHAQSGSHRDDDFCMMHLGESDWYLMAVADGAGSAKFSREGARIACHEAIDCLSAAIIEEFDSVFDKNFLESAPGELPEDLDRVIKTKAYKALGGSAHAANRAILKEAASREANPREYATTLMLAAVRRLAERWLICGFWVGDGGMAVYKSSDEVLVLGEPDSGEFAGQTRFLTSGEVWQDATTINSRVCSLVTNDFTAVVLMTDGVSDPKFETENNLKRADRWDAFWQDLTQAVDMQRDNPELEAQLLEWLSFWSPGNHDDRTIAIMF